MITRKHTAAFASLLSSAALLVAIPVQAQDAQEAGSPEAMPERNFDPGVLGGDFLTVGVGGAFTPSYTGSDDYVLSVLPVALGNIGGVQITPRAAGLRVDFIENPSEGIGLDLGVSARLRNNRAEDIEDEVVIQYGELDRAVEVGPSVGISIPGVLIPVDTLSFSTDVMFDVAGAHEGTVISPSVSYTTPLSRGIIANLSFNAEWADESFQDYYFRVDPLNTLVPDDDALPAYEPDGSGFTSVGVNLLMGFDLDGDATNGGFGVILLGGYSRLVGDAANTPFTTIRGSKDQFLAAIGLTYTFGL
ncbi:MipA/OmpV family protein [Aurantiacibacter sp. MUD61]|uniref:MipA/OmpV family protein n=1 Tax=Aurantiacibacter sp. MUD61 TaxID=3009083 RepID=UPI0022F053DF|nr:MipA/OmpV family protein [Aurantiacibacter sp. MUD61]